MHIALIPARKGSVGFKFKNRKFFKNTANFLKQIKWFDKVIVSTDDEVIKDLAIEYGFVIHNRPMELSGPAVSIKQVMVNVVNEMEVGLDDKIWLFYLPVLYKNINDFEKAREIIDSGKYKSLCSFVSAITHPYNCWKYDEKNGELDQYIQNNIFRRQDLPEAYMAYHYVCCFYSRELVKLNDELINKSTYPYFLDNTTRDNLIEIDTEEDYEKWKLMNKKEDI